LTTAEGGFEGFPPAVSISGPIPQPGNDSCMKESDKYKAMWEHEQYRAVAPGEGIAPLFLAQARPKPGSDVIDFGTGTGRGALMIAMLGGCNVRMLDFADNCLDGWVREALTTQAHAISFARQDLTHPIPWTAEYGYCTDVMEHIPPQEVDVVLFNILKSAQKVFFQISCEDDVCGALIGQPLHLSVHPYKWWLDKLQNEFDCQVFWSQDVGTHCMFYVSAWWTGDKMVDIGVLNTEQQTVLDNVKANVQRGIQQIIPHEPSEVELLILGGGPSLKDSADEIRELVAGGAKIVTLNGAYNWALEQGFQVGAQIVVDARPHNLRFVQPLQDKCKYFLASQVDPALYDACPPDRTYQWHTTAEFIKEILDEHLPNGWFGVFGGSTVLLRAIPLLRMLGFRSMHLFGCDSCCMDDQHHSYAQPENDGQMVIDTIIGGRKFKCVPFHISQAQEFIDLIRVFGDEVELNVHGDGLLAWILQHGCDLDIEREAAEAKLEGQFKEAGQMEPGASEILPNLFIGNWIDAQEFDGERLNVRDGETYPGMTYHVETLIPVPPKHEALYCVSRAKLDLAASIISERLAAGKKLLVHCLVGMERSPLAVAWWMVKTGKHATLSEALAFIKTKRPIVKDRSNWVEQGPVDHGYGEAAVA
jgi:hypothetical protein